MCLRRPRLCRSADGYYFRVEFQSPESGCCAPRLAGRGRRGQQSGGGRPRWPVRGHPHLDLCAHGAKEFLLRFHFFPLLFILSHLSRTVMDIHKQLIIVQIFGKKNIMYFPIIVASGMAAPHPHRCKWFDRQPSTLAACAL